MRFLCIFAILVAATLCHAATYRIERAYEDVGPFQEPIDIQQQDDTVYVAQRTGRIQMFHKDSPESQETFLDLENKVNIEDPEEGLLGLAFHPQFRENGRFFVHYYSIERSETVLSEFRADTGAKSADPQTERKLITIEQKYPNNNGGQLAFGKDGYLYMSVGDGGSVEDPDDNGQNRDNIMGSIVRIDIDREDPPNLYSIPETNPFANGGGAPEIYSYGLRNPGKFSFDSESGMMWIADVGEGKYEEINVASREGQNFGWKASEGCECAACSPGDFDYPVHSYPKSEGVSITGGYVYHGREMPEFNGRYIFADRTTGDILSLDASATVGDCTSASEPLFRNAGTVSTFGVIDDEIYFADYNTGHINKFAKDEDPSPFPSPSSAPNPSPSRSPDRLSSASPSSLPNPDPTPAPSRSRTPTRTAEPNTFSTFTSLFLTYPDTTNIRYPDLSPITSYYTSTDLGSNPDDDDDLDYNSFSSSSGSTMLTANIFLLLAFVPFYFM